MISTRLVSLAQRSVAAIEYVVEAVDEFARVTVQSELVANEDQPPTSADPRVAAVLTNPLESVHYEKTDRGALLMHRTRASELMMAAAMDHDVEVPGRVEVATEAGEDWARTTVICGLRPGQRLRIVKYLAYGWSSLRSRPALRDQVAAAVSGARYTGWTGLLESQRAYLDDFWDSADVEVEGDPDLQQAVRFGLFHVLQASARAERRAIAGKGLTGTGYDGHAFWDTEGFVLPVLTYTTPHAAADALRWRASTLDLARERAAQLDLGARAFPWRTIRGQECSAYWPAGTAAWHINADIAMAFERYRIVTGDDSLEEDCGLEVLVETARLWLFARAPRPPRCLAHRRRDRSRRVHRGGARQHVHQPDGRAQPAHGGRGLCAPPRGGATRWASPPRRPPRGATRPTPCTSPTTRSWACTRSATASHRCGSGTFGQHQPTRCCCIEPYVRLYPAQVIKQADLVLAMHWQSHAFTPEQKARNVDYYERRTTRDSSLSACTQAVMCAEVGHLELAHDYANEAALIDLRDLHHNTRDGLHMASLAGAWTALVAGSAACATTRACCRSTRSCPTVSRGCDSACAGESSG